MEQNGIYDSRLLLVDDNEELTQMLSDMLLREGFRNVSRAACCRETLKYFERTGGGKAMPAPDLVILDINLPDGDGFTLMHRIRLVSQVPVLFLSARDEDSDRLLGLGLGADDYISKPFRPRELVSRMRSVLRRAGKSGRAVHVGELKVDMEKGVVTRAGEELFLSALEYRLFLVFLNNRGKILSRGQLLEEIWDVAGEYVNDNTLTVYIKRLRDKIERDPQSPEIIKTVRGLGYRMEA